MAHRAAHGPGRDVVGTQNGRADDAVPAAFAVADLEDLTANPLAAVLRVVRQRLPKGPVDAPDEIEPFFILADPHLVMVHPFLDVRLVEIEGVRGRDQGLTLPGQKRLHLHGGFGLLELLIANGRRQGGANGEAVTQFRIVVRMIDDQHGAMLRTAFVHLLERQPALAGEQLRLALNVLAPGELRRITQGDDPMVRLVPGEGVGPLLRKAARCDGVYSRTQCWAAAAGHREE